VADTLTEAGAGLSGLELPGGQGLALDTEVVRQDRLEDGLHASSMYEGSDNPSAQAGQHGWYWNVTYNERYDARPPRKPDDSRCSAGSLRVGAVKLTLNAVATQSLGGSLDFRIPVIGMQVKLGSKLTKKRHPQD